jgi:hypothetical protein
MNLYESVPRTQGHRQLQTPDFIRFPLRQLLEHVAYARGRGRLADLNYLSHVLTSMIELYPEDGTGGMPVVTGICDNRHKWHDSRSRGFPVIGVFIFLTSVCSEFRTRITSMSPVIRAGVWCRHRAGLLAGDA